MVQVRAKVEDEQTRKELRDMRRDLQRTAIRPTLLDVATRQVVPTARRLAPSIARDSIVARATTRSAYLTTSARGVKRRIFGLLEFGGTVRGQIYPKGSRTGRGRLVSQTLRGGEIRRAAVPLKIGGRLIFRAYVHGPRHYKPNAFLQRAVEQEVRSFERRLAEEVPAAMQRRLDGIAKSRLT